MTGADGCGSVIPADFSNLEFKIKFKGTVKFKISCGFKPNPIKFCQPSARIAALINGYMIIPGGIVFVQINIHFSIVIIC